MRKRAPAAYLGGDDRSCSVFRWPTLVAVRGESMRPTLRHGDLIVASPCRGNPRSGEVVVLRTPMGIVVHRVVGQDWGADGRTYYRTAGDANRREDTFVVPREAILGAVRARLPWLGFPHLWATRTREVLATRLGGGRAKRVSRRKARS